MFIYGMDIPVEEAAVETTRTAADAAGPVAPLEYIFEYGKPLFPENEEA